MKRITAILLGAVIVLCAAVICGSVESVNFTFADADNFTLTNHYASKMGIPREEFEFIYELLQRIHERNRSLPERMAIGREFCNFVYRYSSIHAGPYDANPDYIDKMPKDFLGNVRRLIYVFTEMEYLDASYRQLQLVRKACRVGLA